MSRKIVAASAALATAAVTLIAAPAAEAAGRGVTHVKVSKKATVTVPATLRPGVVHLRNDGSRSVLIVRKQREGVSSLVKYLNTDSEKLGKRAYTRFGFIEILVGRADDYVKLGKGTYYFVGEADKVKAAKVRTVVVKGKTSNATRPAARNVTVTSKNRLGGATTGPAKTALRVRNQAGSPRALFAFRIPATVTEAKVDDLVARPSSQKLFEVLGEDGFATLRSLAYVGSRQDVTVTPKLAASRYLLWQVAPFGSQDDIRAGQLARLTLR